MSRYICSIKSFSLIHWILITARRERKIRSYWYGYINNIRPCSRPQPNIIYTTNHQRNLFFVNDLSCRKCAHFSSSISLDTKNTPPPPLFHPLPLHPVETNSHHSDCHSDSSHTSQSLTSRSMTHLEHLDAGALFY
jgi:hypothetical protein